jgi:hypothetical protein
MQKSRTTREPYADSACSDGSKFNPVYRTVLRPGSQVLKGLAFGTEAEGRIGGLGFNLCGLHPLELLFPYFWI